MGYGSKAVSWLLRHGAPSVGVAMDAAGWVAVADVLRHLKLSPAELEQIVAENNKTRFEVRGDQIRASQGHSTETPVTREALEASWTPYTGDGPLYHGTTRAAVPSILAQGILPQARTHVHLAAAPDSRVGKRANVEVLLEVNVACLRGAGLGVWQSANGVLLARLVPPSCVVVSRPL
jgi:putative RNA 2'-phosphotransferase